MAIKMGQHNELQTIKAEIGEWKEGYRKSCREEIILSCLCIRHTDITHSYLLKQEQQPWWVGCHSPYSVKHLLIDCINLTPKRQYFYSVNNIKELFEHAEVDKILAFLKAVGLYKRIKTFNIQFMYMMQTLDNQINRNWH